MFKDRTLILPSIYRTFCNRLWGGGVDLISNFCSSVPKSPFLLEGEWWCCFSVRHLVAVSGKLPNCDIFLLPIVAVYITVSLLVKTTEKKP